MPTVECKLTDCSKHGRTICMSKDRISIDGCGLVECYDPVPKSTVVHGDVPQGYKHRGRWAEKKGKAFR